MANTDEPEVKIIDRVEIAPAGDDEETVEPEPETDPDSSQGKNDDEGEPEAEEEAEPSPKEPEAPSEPEETPEPENAAPEKIEIPNEEYGKVKRLPGETNREFAYRIEIARLHGEKRKEQVKEIMIPPVNAAPVKKELSPEKKAVLAKYKPEDISALRDVFDVMADDMGFVKKEELGATTIQQKQTEVLDDFLDAHPEYMPKNDPQGILWGAFKQEFQLYKTPQNPRDLKNVLNKVHKEVFGIKPAAALNKQEAAKEKIKVASHSGSSKPAPSREGVKRENAPIQGLRTDMLKGFTDEEIAEMTG